VVANTGVGRSVGRWGLVVALTILAVGTLTVVGVVAWLDRSVDRVDVDGLGATPPPPAVGRDDDGSDEDGDPDDGSLPAPDVEDVDVDVEGDALTVLVLGSDSREVLTPEERAELGTGDAWGERTETIVLLRLDPDADEMRLVSVPRDTLLTRCDGSRGRVNAAYAIGEREGVGGMSCVVETLTTWAGVTIDHAVKVDFRGFVDIVDNLGGVPIVLDEPIRDRRANLDLEAGCTRLDGAQSLAFVRARSIDDDYGRMGRQQRFVEELRRELATVGVFDDAPRLLRTAEAVARSVELDSTLTLNRIQQLVRQHRATVASPIDGRSMLGEPDLGSDGTYFLAVDQDDARDSIRWLEGDDEAGDVLVDPDREGVRPPGEQDDAAEQDDPAEQDDEDEVAEVPSTTVDRGVGTDAGRPGGSSPDEAPEAPAGTGDGPELGPAEAPRC
jgi:LCP family protein required for cell wall assembly